MKVSIINPDNEQIAEKYKNPQNKSFYKGQRFKLTGTGWRTKGNFNFPVLETDCGVSINLGLFEPKQDFHTNRDIIPVGPMADFFRENACSMTSMQMINELYEQFKDRTFTTDFCFYTYVDKSNILRKASNPMFLYVEE